MAKVKIAFVCNECGAEHGKWQGQCHACGVWNSLQEIRLDTPVKAAFNSQTGYAGQASELLELSAVDIEQVPRFTTHVGELDRVLGGGLVPGAAILIGGHPGAGKSTLLLQIMCDLAQEMEALYVTGEESIQQVALRAKRLGLPTNNLKMLVETDVGTIIASAQKLQPKLLVVDSIQVVQRMDINSAAGSVVQVRECAAALIRYAKQTQTVLLLVGHVTKDGSLAGPKVLEHMIDCSLQLEGDSNSRFRTLRSHKNRFGAVNELGVFAMLETGIKEVKNPSSIFLSRADVISSGSLVMVIWEGTRPLLVELQALVDQTQFNHPKRVAVGLDANRLAMLLAVLHRHGGIHAGDLDVFINVVGGVKVNETSADLALLIAIVSSLRDRPIDERCVIFGEIGLSGEIRPVPSGQERIREAAKHGFTKAIVPFGNVNAATSQYQSMQIIGVKSLQEALDIV